MSQFFEPKPKRTTTQQGRVDEANWEGRFAAIEKESDAILKAEGAHFVRGTYFVQAGDAYMARMIAAEQVVAKRDASMDRYIAKGRITFPGGTVDGVPLFNAENVEYVEDCQKDAVDDETPAPCPEMSVTEGLSDADLAARMLQHTAMVCRLVTDAMGVKS